MKHSVVAVAGGLLASALLAVACTRSLEPDSFSGLWSGSNSEFAQFQLDLRQTEDVVRGRGTFRLVGSLSSYGDTILAVADGDSLRFLIAVVPSPDVRGISFAGERVGSWIMARANSASIVLSRD
ncbi:MAG: hypothetical protein ACRDGN_00895 [bacterium]